MIQDLLNFINFINLAILDIEKDIVNSLLNELFKF